MAQRFLSDIHATAGFKDSSGDLGTNGQVLSSTGSGTNWINQTSGSTAINLDNFTGNGSATAFTLGQTPPNENVTQVYIDGVYQEKGTYSISGTTLTFSTAPPNSSGIEVISFETITSSGGTLTATTFSGDLSGTINTATTATTQSAGNNSTKVATTAYADAKVADAINNGTTAIAPSQNAVFDALALKANLAGPTFTGTPAAPTASAGTNTTQLATTAFVTTGIANIVDSAPGALDTLNELAAALGDDANFSTTVTNSIATKAPLASPTFTGNATFNLDGDSSLLLSDGGTNASVIKAGSGDELYIGANNTYALRFLSDGTNNVVFDNSSKVGIGVASPTWKLTVSDGTITGFIMLGAKDL